MVRCGRLFDPHEILWVQTDDIVYACNLRPGDSDRWRDRGNVLSGEWDRALIKFTDTDIYHACAEHFHVLPCTLICKDIICNTCAM